MDSKNSRLFLKIVVCRKIDFFSLFLPLTLFQTQNKNVIRNSWGQKLGQIHMKKKKNFEKKIN